MIGRIDHHPAPPPGGNHAPGSQPRHDARNGFNRQAEEVRHIQARHRKFDGHASAGRPIAPCDRKKEARDTLLGRLACPQDHLGLRAAHVATQVPGDHVNDRSRWRVVTTLSWFTMV